MLRRAYQGSMRDLTSTLLEARIMSLGLCPLSMWGVCTSRQMICTRNVENGDVCVLRKWGGERGGRRHRRRFCGMQVLNEGQDVLLG